MTPTYVPVTGCCGEVSDQVLAQRMDDSGQNFTVQEDLVRGSGATVVGESRSVPGDSERCW